MGNISSEDRTRLPVYLLAICWDIELVGGVNEVVLSLGEELKKGSAYRPVIAELMWDRGPATSVARGIPVLKLRARDVSRMRLVFAWLATLPADLLTLSRFLRGERVAVVNFHYPTLGAIVFFFLRWSRLYRGKLVFSFHGADIAAIKNLRGIFGRIWSRLIASADGVVTCSEALRRQVLEVAPAAKRVAAIHNGVDASLFRPKSRVRGHGRTVLHIGRFEHKKSQDVLLTAFDSLVRRMPETKLILVGASGPTLNTIREQIARLNLQDRVELHVDVPHERVPDFFARADLFVLPSRAEPFGLVVLEAGAAGVPVVASNVGGVPELIEHGITGMLVPVDDPVALETEMWRMLTDFEAAGRMAAAWHEKVLACWSWRNTCSQYLRFIESLDGGKSS